MKELKNVKIIISAELEQTELARGGRLNLKYYIHKYPATTSIIIITVLVYLIEIIMGGSTNNQVLYRLGALTTYSVQQGQWWRLITPIFLHIGFQHILFNMLTLMIFGFYMEPFLGIWRFLVIYLFGGVYGNLLSFAFLNNRAISAGASSSIFALFGIFVLMRRSLINNTQYKNLSGQIMGLAIFNLVIDVFDNFFGGSINLLAHVGGFIGGYLLSVILGSPQAENYKNWQRILAIVLIVSSALFLYKYGMGRFLV